jgi:hypothetical protein
MERQKIEGQEKHEEVLMINKPSTVDYRKRNLNILADRPQNIIQHFSDF